MSMLPTLIVAILPVTFASSRRVDSLCRQPTPLTATGRASSANEGNATREEYSGVSRRQVINAQLERSYLTPSRGISNLPALIFEEHVAAHFMVRDLAVFSMVNSGRMLDVN